ncbi:hypothetical protein SK128_021189 [Halocaridina rubra]|uniref:Uncharacterized protein n=1 Tax=Halocaridina rubra TaxID=373956 RepID=A0AAN8WL95_HALRR
MWRSHPRKFFGKRISRVNISDLNDLRYDTLNLKETLTEGGKPALTWCRYQARVDGGGLAAGRASGHKNLTKIWTVQITGQKHQPYIKVGKDVDEDEEEDL